MSIFIHIMGSCDKENQNDDHSIRYRPIFEGPLGMDFHECMYIVTLLN